QMDMRCSASVECKQKCLKAIGSIFGKCMNKKCKC
uniref:NU-buthitoxin-Ptr1a n=2 Tax=Parabuthus transvaalicus TaxID=170972 RepID=TXN1A_PARTR|nr:RecName: Full=NU-buthitoxin-Ptr1a; Short=N-BUTX-Ptr1a; Short=NU-BUTX-Ptr1a [Parabuthus transvaalicus]6SAB_A Chain A, M-BUTX-Ptr1a [Parabuthus transvaalicus]